MSGATLADFLLARIAEDEANARDRGADAMVGARWKHYPEDAYVEVQSLTLAHSRRVLADCEAKRAVLKIHARLADSPENERYEYNHDGWMRDSCIGCNWGGPCDDYHVEHVDQCPTLRALALPYADHPDYRQEWKP